MVVGFVTCFLVMRGADLTRLMVTLGIALLLEALANRFSNITGGFDGLQGIVMAPMLGLFRVRHVRQDQLLLLLIVLFVMFLLARRIVHSPFGLSLRAIRNNPLRAAAIGIPVNRRLIAIYTVAAFYAGIAGALLTQTTALASLDVFSFERSADLMLVLVIGGTGYLYGGLIGAVVFKLLQDVLQTITPQYWHVLDRAGSGHPGAGRARAHASLDHVGAEPHHPPVFGRKAVVAVRRRVTRHDDRAGNQGPGKSFGGLTRHARPVAESRARRPPRADRPERRRQDHGDQPSDRRAPPNAGRILLEGNDITELPVHTARAARAVAHVPDQPAVRRSDPAGNHCACGLRAARPGQRWWSRWARATTSTQEIEGRWRAFICST